MFVAPDVSVRAPSDPSPPNCVSPVIALPSPAGYAVPLNLTILSAVPSVATSSAVTYLFEALGVS
jgi:hypothetical protein